MKNKILNINSLLAILCVVLTISMLQSCGDDDEIILPATCFDGMMNGDETGVDCGGDCQACPTCNDNIMNGDEEGVDCGGSNCDACEATVVRFSEFMSAGYDTFHTFEGADTGMTVIDGDPGNDVTSQGASLPMITFGVIDPLDPLMLVGRYNRPEGNISGGFSDYKFEINETGPYDLSDLGDVKLSVFTPTGTITGSVAPTIEIIFIARNDENPEFWTNWTILEATLSETDTWETFTFDGSGVEQSMNDLGVEYNQIVIRIGGSGHQEGATFYIKDFFFVN